MPSMGKLPAQTPNQAANTRICTKRGGAIAMRSKGVKDAKQMTSEGGSESNP
jgi:hypothetical protein